jgi:hypothetical protein
MDNKQEEEAKKDRHEILEIAYAMSASVHNIEYHREAVRQLGELRNKHWKEYVELAVRFLDWVHDLKDPQAFDIRQAYVSFLADVFLSKDDWITKKHKLYGLMERQLFLGVVERALFRRDSKFTILYIIINYSKDPWRLTKDELFPAKIADVLKRNLQFQGADRRSVARYLMEMEKDHVLMSELKGHKRIYSINPELLDLAVSSLPMVKSQEELVHMPTWAKTAAISSSKLYKYFIEEHKASTEEMVKEFMKSKKEE